MLDENNVVKNIIVISNNDIDNLPFPESEPHGIELCKFYSNNPNSIWKQTSRNNNFRVRYAIIGGTYDPIKDAFIPKQPFNSWILDPNTLVWVPPIPYPNDYLTVQYVWDESNLTWIHPDNL